MVGLRICNFVHQVFLIATLGIPLRLNHKVEVGISSHDKNASTLSMEAAMNKRFSLSANSIAVTTAQQMFQASKMTVWNQAMSLNFARQPLKTTEKLCFVL